MVNVVQAKSSWYYHINERLRKMIIKIGRLALLSINPTKWSNTLNQFVLLECVWTFCGVGLKGQHYFMITDLSSREIVKTKKSQGAPWEPFSIVKLKVIKWSASLSRVTLLRGCFLTFINIFYHWQPLRCFSTIWALDENALINLH